MPLKAIMESDYLRVPKPGEEILGIFGRELAALDERIAEHLGTKRPLRPLVPDAVNSMKHDVDAGIAVGWKVRFGDILDAADELCGLLEKAVTSSLGAV